MPVHFLGSRFTNASTLVICVIQERLSVQVQFPPPAAAPLPYCTVVSCPRVRLHSPHPCGILSQRGCSTGCFVGMVETPALQQPSQSLQRRAFSNHSSAARSPSCRRITDDRSLTAVTRQRRGCGTCASLWQVEGLPAYTRRMCLPTRHRPMRPLRRRLRVARSMGCSGATGPRSRLSANPVTPNRHPPFALKGRPVSG